MVDMRGLSVLTTKGSCGSTVGFVAVGGGREPGRAVLARGLRGGGGAISLRTVGGVFGRPALSSALSSAQQLAVARAVIEGTWHINTCE